MATVTLTGKLSDIASAPVDTNTKAFVKAPTYQFPASTTVTTTQPVPVTVSQDGAFSLTVNEGEGYLYIEGAGWSDTIPFYAVTGMSTFFEAWARAMNDGVYTLVRELIDAMGDSTEVRLSALVEQAKAYYDFIVNSPAAVAPWHKPALGQADLNTILVPGTYPQYTAANVTIERNYPVAGYRGNLTVLPTSETNTNLRIQVYTLEKGTRYTRFIYGANNWSKWSNVGAFRQGALTGSENLDLFTTESESGGWSVNSVAIATSLGLPEAMPGFFTVKWIVGNGSDSAYVVQTFEPVGGSNKVWRRSRMSTNLWTPWVDNSQATPTPTGAISLTAESRREQLINSRGGRIGTGGRGVVAFRFDHNVTPFQEKVLPLLVERGLPGSMAHFAQEMTPTEAYTNSNEVGKTWADVTRQFFQGIEVWSHSYTHTDPATDADMVKEIVQSRADLETFIPEASVVGWFQPGFTGGKYGGYGDLHKSPEYHGTTRAGQLIDETYGADDRSGAMLTPLGSRNFGCLWIDTATSPTATNAVISEAAATGVGVVIALHPSMVDASGGISTATYTAILDHIVSLRDAGDIVVLTTGGMSVADPGTTWRHNLAPALSTWSGGTVVPTGRDISGSPITARFSVGNHTYVHGQVRELEVTTSGTGNVTVNVQDRNNVLPLNETRSYSVQGSRVLHFPVGIARGNSGVKLTITCTSGSVVVTDVKLQAL